MKKKYGRNEEENGGNDEKVRQKWRINNPSLNQLKQCWTEQKDAKLKNNKKAEIIGKTCPTWRKEYGRNEEKENELKILKK